METKGDAPRREGDHLNAPFSGVRVGTATASTFRGVLWELGHLLLGAVCHWGCEGSAQVLGSQSHWKPLSLSLARPRAEGQPPDLEIAQISAVTEIFQPHFSIVKLKITCKLFSILKFLFHLQGTADVPRWWHPQSSCWPTAVSGTCPFLCHPELGVICGTELWQCHCWSPRALRVPWVCRDRGWEVLWTLQLWQTEIVSQAPLNERSLRDH